MIFLDTSAIYALVDATDRNHAYARQLFERILQEQTSVVTHNYVVIESIALLHRRLGVAKAVAFEETTRNFEVVWIDQETHRQALQRWAKGRRTLSFVDHVSFVVMERLHIDTAFAFDSDFVAAGFSVVTAARRR